MPRRAHDLRHRDAMKTIGEQEVLIGEDGVTIRRVAEKKSNAKTTTRPTTKFHLTTPTDEVIESAVTPTRVSHRSGFVTSLLGILLLDSLELSFPSVRSQGVGS